MVKRRRAGIEPALPPPEEREEIKRQNEETKRIFREKQREIRKHYMEKMKEEQDS